ncbi:HAMP domain-containing histidine kinase [Paenibacillus alkaliterrae]|uniref:HAMP domain-containing sensor histidine kinase n=1 Tax=Paenibacillus alkaliterrae TaxID=320909 RepID=UPI001F387366|nr:HAMP domain-containing histidine kinase [Paenibacillus alkaliterrae]MCF2940978.1 HAMP domain-containing histidine kinase [Paenibacillus alkaliterrae]
MSKLTLSFSRMPVKWKLTIGSALLLFLLFAAYNIVQYIFVERWMMKQEEENTQRDMREILNFLLEKEFSFNESELAYIRNYLEKMNERNQLIRVLDDKGAPIIVVSDEVPDHWAQSYPSSRLIHSGLWFLDDHLLLMRSPLTIFKFNGTVEIIKNIEEFDRLSTAFFRIMLICCLGAVIISGIGGRLIARQLLRPLQAMNETMTNVKEKGLQERVQLYENKSDEIASLMKLFNEMMDQVERSFDRQKQFVEDASHELRTPVAIIEGHLALLQRWGKDDRAVLEESLDASVQELSRLKRLVEELLVLSRAEKEQPNVDTERSYVEEAILNTVKNVTVLHPEFDFDIELSSLANVLLIISEQHLEQIMLILLDNAVKYSGGHKKICIKSEMREKTAVIHITDFGLGISEQDLPFVTNRFYRADKVRSGMNGGHGLGLSIAERLVGRYGGNLLIRSKEHEGTTVSVSLNIAERE